MNLSNIRKIVGTMDVGMKVTNNFQKTDTSKEKSMQCCRCSDSSVHDIF